MASEFHFGYDQQHGFRQIDGPRHINLQAVLDAMRLWDIHPPLGFVGHQPGYPDWQVFAKPPGSREVRGLLFEDAEYAQYEYDPYRAAREALGLAFVGRAIDASIPRRRVVSAPVPVDDPDYLPFAHGLFRVVDVVLRKKSYWSVLPPTVGAGGSALSWFVSRYEGAVPVARLDEFFPPVGDTIAAAPPQPAPPTVPDPNPAEGELAAAMARIEDVVRDAVAGLTRRVDDLAARIMELEREPRLADDARLERVEEAVREAAASHAPIADLACQLADLREAVARLGLPIPGPPGRPPDNGNAFPGLPATRGTDPTAGTPAGRRDRLLGRVVLVEATLCLVVLLVLLGHTLIRAGR